MFSHAAHTHARSHVVATYYTTILLNRAGLRSVAASRDACKGATIDWYSFRGRLYPRTFSRSFVTRRNRGGHRNVPSIRPTSDALHAPLSLPSFSILRAHVRLANTSAVFPFYTRWKNARAFSLFFSLSIFLSVPTVRVYRKQTRLFSNLPNLNSSSIGSGFFFFFFFFQMTRSSSSVRDLKCVSRGIFFSRFRKWRSLLGRERGGWLFVLKTTRGRWERE